MRIKDFSCQFHKELLAVCAGVLFTLAFAPFNYAYLTLLALSIFFAVCLKTNPKRALLRGYLFGLGQFGIGVSWVYVSIHDFGDASIIVSIALTALLVGFWSLFPAFSGYLFILLTPKNKLYARIILMPVIWMLVEYLRGEVVLNGFPWLQLAYSQLDTPLSGYIPVLGVYGTGFILAVTAAIILAFLHNKNSRWLVIIAVLWGTGSLLKTINWTTARGEAIQATLIQGNIRQDQKWQPENRVKTLLLYKNLTEQHWDSPIIVWPETAIPAYFSAVNEVFLIPLSKMAKQHHSDLIVSLPVEGEANEKYNAVMTLGKETGIYRKQHLLPFGEYLPLQPWSGFITKSLNIPMSDFSAGNKTQTLLKAGGYSFITSICYEDAFGTKGIQPIEDAAYLVNVSNDGWFGHSLEPYQHLQMARMRALETGRFMLRATNTGVTAIIAADGKIIKQAPLFQVDTLTGNIIPMKGMTFYARIGDKPIICGLLLLLLLLLLKNLGAKERI